jgi:hypothetical protein
MREIVMGFLSAFQRKKPDDDGGSAYRIVELLDRYLNALDQHGNLGPREYCVSLIARAPSSPAAFALALRADELGKRHVQARLIFAKPAPSDVLVDLLREMRPLFRGESASERVRWARNPGLLDAHEQLTLGSSFCWSGDAMRRSPQRQPALELIEENAPGSVRLAALAFSAMWSASKRLSPAQTGTARRSVLSSLSDVALAVHRRETAAMPFDAAGDEVTRH